MLDLKIIITVFLTLFITEALQNYSTNKKRKKNNCDNWMCCNWKTCEHSEYQRRKQERERKKNKNDHII